MKRLTFEGNFCDIAMCAEVPGGSFCEDGACSQRKVWERLKQYEDAEAEGRLVVLPCKVGDKVYISGHRFEAIIEEITINIQDGVVFNWVEYDMSPELTEVWDDGWFEPKDFGKTVFLTREEAEAALRGEKE